MREASMSVSSRVRRLALSILLAGGLGACVAQDQPLTQCEPGVEGLSHMTDVAPGNC